MSGCQQGCILPADSRKESASFLFSASKGYLLHSLAHGPFFKSLQPLLQLSHLLLLPLILLPPFYKDLALTLGPSGKSGMIIWDDNLSISRFLITFTISFLPSKVTYSQVTGIQTWSSLVLGEETLFSLSSSFSREYLCLLLPGSSPWPSQNKIIAWDFLDLQVV